MAGDRSSIGTTSAQEEALKVFNYLALSGR